MAKLANEDPKAWKQLIVPTVFSINSKIDSIGFSPFQLLYGYQPRSAIKKLILQATTNVNTRNSIVLLRTEKLDEIRHRATEQQLVMWKKRVEKHVLSLKHHQYHVRDLVLYHNIAKRNQAGDPCLTAGRHRLR